jgi:hypothetical protein
MDFSSSSDKELLELWDSESDFEVRNRILEEMQKPSRNLFPSMYEDPFERKYGMYPDLDDPRFHEKLFKKREFLENKQKSIAQQQEELTEQGTDLCDPDQEFELSPVQRFISRFLSPQCPYQGALLYHGVGVGKTCAAIATAEAQLQSYPFRKVIIVAPPNIQPGFRRTIFDIDAVKIPTEENSPNTLSGCTGNYYLKATGTEYEKDRNVIKNRVNALIDARYEFYGYIQFARYIEETSKEGAYAKQAISREFDGRLVIVDEAHNLRNVPGETTSDNLDTTADEGSQSEAGKKLVPSLQNKLLKFSRGMKLLLMTATPMYNNYLEIISLLNFLLQNDKKARLNQTDIFNPDGSWITDDEGREIGKERLGVVASKYVSFMRGENPLMFPIRLTPLNVEKIKTWPRFPPNATGEEIPEKEQKRTRRLPLVPVQYDGKALQHYMDMTDTAVSSGGISVAAIDKMVQSGNWIFPAEEGTPIEQRVGESGFDSCFRAATDREGKYIQPVQFESRRGTTDFLRTPALKQISAKANFFIERVRHATGVVFVYSRFIKSGAIPLVLSLEANGYLPYGRSQGFLKDSGVKEDGYQCAFCSKKKREHRGLKEDKHVFKVAQYILLTGSASISPNNTAMVKAARANDNSNGGQIKLILGSQVAGEGIDLRFIRELYIFDSWFHLNKMEQIIGRGVRTCSHSMLPPKKITEDGEELFFSNQNCTIYLLVNTFPESEDRETADLYMYRNAMNKAIQVGKVARVLKEYALDCNLNIDAIQIPSAGEGSLKSQQHIDAQGIWDHPKRREVIVHDMPYTTLCDWLETCDYTCKVDETTERAPLPSLMNSEAVDSTTYDEYAAKVHESSVKRAIRALFSQQISYQFDDLNENLSGIPPLALSSILSTIVGNQSFRVIGPNKKEGYIIYRNGYYLFQPDTLSDIRLPLALRVANFPVKRDFYLPAVEKTAVVEIKSDISLWSEIVHWAETIQTGTAEDEVPETLYAAMETRYAGDAQEINKAKQQLEIMIWIYEKIKSKPESCKALAAAILFYVWDEVLKVSEQQKLVAAATSVIEKVANEQIVKKGSTTAFRYVDVVKGNLKYICGDADCGQAVVGILEKDPADPLNSLKADISTTGGMYGFMVPKNGELIFKTNEKVAQVGKVPEKGGECGNISTVSYHVGMLKRLYTILDGLNEKDIKLTSEMVQVRKRVKEEGKYVEKDVMEEQGTLVDLRPKRIADHIKKLETESETKLQEYLSKNPWQKHPRNAVRACTLKDILLRYMDAKRLGDKRWFYRPVASLKTKHKGKLVKT